MLQLKNKWGSVLILPLTLFHPLSFTAHFCFGLHQFCKYFFLISKSKFCGSTSGRRILFRFGVFGSPPLTWLFHLHSPKSKPLLTIFEFSFCYHQVHSTSKKLLYQLDHLVRVCNQPPPPGVPDHRKHVSFIVDDMRSFTN